MNLRTLKRRRLEGKTDYKLRLNILKSTLPRIVIRRTNKYFIAQIVKSIEAKDKVVIGVTSKELLNYGWDKKTEGTLKSIPAGYLTGYLLAKKTNKGEYIVDLGMAKNHKGGRLYSVIAGLIDGGLNVHASKEILPVKEKLNGEDKMKEMVATVKKRLENPVEKKKTVKTKKEKEAKK
jgi:large subunit ribosomal protein L18